MKKRKDHWQRIVGYTVLGAMAMLFLFVLLGLANLLFLVQGAWLFLTGWLRFPLENIPKISWSANALLSGGGALLAALGGLHYLGRRYIPAWKWQTTAAFGAFLPILFFMSFFGVSIVSSARGLITKPTLNFNRSIPEEREWAISTARDLVFGLTEEDEFFPLRLPDSLDARRSRDRIAENEILYPGAGLPAYGDQPFPLIISAPYYARNQLIRSVIHSDRKEAFVEQKDFPALLRQIALQRRELTAKKP